MKTNRLLTNSVDWSFIDEGAGMPLLFVHGFPLDHSMWRYQIEELSNRARVIVPDLPGFGKSRVLESTPVSMRYMANQLCELIDSLAIDEPICFCGLSMGGYIGWQFWKNHGQKLASLVACDTRSLADTPVTARAREMMARQIEQEGPEVIADGLIEKLFAPTTFVDWPELIANTRQIICKSDRQIVAASHRAMAVRPDATPWLANIEIPTLIVVGEHDVISTPDEMSTIASSINNSTFVEIARAGHMAPLEQPTAFNTAISEFLFQ